VTATEDVWAVPLAEPPADPPTSPRAQRTPADGQTPPVDRTPPHDLAAERAVLGAALLQPDIVPDIAAILRDDDWYLAAHETVWHAITDRAATGQPVDVITIAADIGLHRTLTGHGGPLYVNALAADPAVTIANVTWHARVVSARAAERRTIELGTKLVQAGHGAAEPDQVRGWLEAHLADRNVADRPRLQVRDIDTFLHQDDEDDAYDWVIPGFLERQDRLMLTGPEGGGKSTLCRQIAVMAAAGMHPFTGELLDTAPRVLYIDLENSERQSRRKLRPLRVQAGSLLEDPTRLSIEVRSAGVDLLQADELRWFLDVVDAARPDLLITGPLYRMASGDPVEEKTAKPVSMALDRVRERGCAVLIETHTPHAASGQRKRPTRPYGASLWLRWPEFGLHLSAEGEIEHWRGARDERDFPMALARGGDWPWTPVTDENQLRWARIRQARQLADDFMSIRDVVEATGISRATVGRVLQKYRYDWLILNGRDPKDQGDDE
jgi:hypothetical protein